GEVAAAVGGGREERGGGPGRGGGRQGRGGPRVFVGFFGDDKPDGVHVTQVAPGSPAERAGIKPGDVVKAVGKKPLTSLNQLVEQTGDLRAGDRLTLTVQRDKETQDVLGTLAARQQQRRGGSPTRPWGAALAGQRENVQDRQGPDGPQTGGVYKSTDGGETWARVNSLNPRPMYFSQVRVDPSDDKYVYVLGV